jgi:polar amino acid transport system substrate-binding protein
MTKPKHGPARMLWLLGGLALVVLALGACGGSSDAGGGSANASTTGKCQAKYKVPGAQGGKLKVGVIQYPPYSSVTDGKAGGIDGEIISKFAQDTCLDLQISETSFAAAVSSITSGRNQVAIGDLYRTKARAAEVSLSDPVYLDQPSIISKQGISTIQGLTGKKIATVQGYYFVDDVKKTFGNSVQLFPDNIKMYQDLLAGRSDAGLDSAPAAIAYLKSQGADGKFQVKVPPSDPRVKATGAQTAQSGFAYDHNVAGLGQALNAYLKDLRASGDLARIVGKYGLPKSAADVGPARLL